MVARQTPKALTADVVGIFSSYLAEFLFLSTSTLYLPPLDFVLGDPSLPRSCPQLQRDVLCPAGGRWPSLSGQQPWVSFFICPSRGHLFQFFDRCLFSFFLHSVFYPVEGGKSVIYCSFRLHSSCCHRHSVSLPILSFSDSILFKRRIVG